LRIEDRRANREQLQRGYNCRGGIFTVLLVIGGALAVPAFLITSGIGLRELRREIGVLRAIGWKTRDVIEKVAFENLAVALAAACLSILLSMAWMKGMNGILIAQFYVSEIGLLPAVDIPTRTLPSHALLLLVFALVVTQIGGLISVWARALRPPRESMR
jgi:ABC-type antimicrobial peptide transport system permease subunit